MTSPRTLLARIAGLLRRGAWDARLDDEVRFHVEMLAADYERRGLAPEAARAAAARQFGGVIQMKEAYRDQRGLPFVETLVQDVRYGVRALLRTPGFTLAALLTLALGIGANSAIFSVVNAVLLQPLPYEAPERIVQLHRQGNGVWAGQTGHRYLFHRDHMTTVEALAAWRNTAFNLVARDHAEHVPALAVSKEYFAVFSGTPLHGRTFDALEDAVHGPDAVVLGHGIWQRMFAGDPAVVGSAISLGDRPFTIVGIMPREFDRIRPAEIYVPLKPSTTGPGGGTNYLVAGRLRPEVSLAQANAEVASLFEAYKATLPNANFAGVPPPILVPYQEGLSRGVRPALLMMLGAVALLLVIACANTANLLLARASSRGREISVRAALGAGRGRLVRQLVTESLVLFIAGGLLGVLLAYWAVPLLMRMTPAGYLPYGDVRVDAQVLGVALVVSAVTGIVFGLAPALSLSRHDLVTAFKDDGTRSTGSRRSAWLRRGLVVGEIALCMVLLVAAGLLVQTFVRLRTLDAGFDTRNVLTAKMSLLGDQFGTSAAVNRLYDLGVERLRRIPGVVSAAVVNGVPIETGLNLNIDRLDTPAVENGLTDWRYATPDYFATLGIEVIAGRGLNDRDTASAPRVAVVSEQFARQHYPGAEALGQRFTVFAADGPIEIVGIARDLREAGLTGPVPAVMYVPVAQAGDAAVRASHMYFQVSWVVRASGLTPELAASIREELRAIAPRQPVTAVRSMDEIKARAMATETFQMTLLTAFGGIGLLLAAAGIYGLIAYSVTQHAREFGIRMALGAARRRILLSVLRQGAVLAAAGVALGTVASVAFTRSLQAFVFDVSTLDAATFFIVGFVLLVVAVAASLVPAVRATRLDPVSALRQ
jgi:putative ABC transport system permease protein